jgi:hypothetical protein
MNKHIKQFERESGLDVYALGLDKAKWESRLEKFAELIVAECAQQAHDLADMLAMHRDKSGAEIAESVGNTIKEHFGVKL